MVILISDYIYIFFLILGFRIVEFYKYLLFEEKKSI